MTTQKIQLLFDLYWLRFKKPGEQWYELTDYLREKLEEDGFNIQYTEDNLIAKKGTFRISIKETINEIK